MIKLNLSKKIKDSKLEIIIGKNAIQLNILNKNNKNIMLYQPIPYKQCVPIIVEGLTINLSKINIK